ncbi:MAG: PAS domain-containing sensor histidine kinase [Candidatus Dormibacteraceae bacterium]
MSIIGKNPPDAIRSLQDRRDTRAKATGTTRLLGRVLTWAADVQWRDALAIAFTAGAVAASAVLVGDAVRENKNVLVILGALAALMTVAGQTAMRREMLERLAESRRYWFRSSPRGLAEVDADLQFMEGNSRLASLLGIAESDLPGKRLTAFFDDHVVVGIVSQFSRLLDGAVGTTESDDLAIRSENERIWLHWRATAVRRRNGSFQHFVITFEDSTQKHVAEAAAHANLAELEKLNHMKTEFTSMVSHEFRTALTGIQGMSELINAGQMKPAEVHEYSGYIFQEAERVNRLITDMLDLDRLEAGKMTLQMSPLDLNAIVEGVAVRSSVVSSKHRISPELEPDVPMVLGDSDRLVQVITNLVSNAIKYSPAGGDVLISTHFANDAVEVSIRDHGVGIPADFVDRLFGRFERYEKSPSKVIGTGLGLAIARQIIEMHGGKIWVESAEGSGSVFRFTIPAVATSMPEPKRPTNQLHAVA